MYMKIYKIYLKSGRRDKPSANHSKGGSSMKKLISLIIVAMFALSMSLGTFAASQDKTAAPSSTEEKPKKTKKTKKTKETKDTSTTTKKSSTEKAPAAAPAK